MNAQPGTAKKGVIQTCLSILQDIYHGYHPRNFAVRFWDGTQWDPETGEQAIFTMVIQHTGALRKMFLSMSELSLGEAYIYNDFDVEGDLEAAFRMGEKLLKIQRTPIEKFKLAYRLMKLPAHKTERTGRQAAQLSGALHSRERDRQAVTYHYNVSNDFFRLWLGPRMVYSCAYFSSPDEDLDIAQERKLDYICRKLRLQPGEKLLDIGCGWGGLIIYAAKRYGVTAHGITLSEPQVQWADEQIRKEGLSDRCKAEICDYRDVNEPGGYDKIASIGMFEHVGERMLPEYFRRALHLLRPRGLFLNHGIALGLNQAKMELDPFSDSYVFPDGQLVPINITLRAAERAGFEVRDVESLREHYMLTLRHWLRRLEANHAEASRLTDEATYRTWRINHAGSAAGFESGRNIVYQSLLVKPADGISRLPLTRADWYV